MQMPQRMADADKALTHRMLPAFGCIVHLTTSHHTDVISSARLSAVSWLRPMAPAPNTSARQTTKGMQLPM